MKKNITLIFTILWAASLPAQIMVLPFKVDTQNHASYQWLGKAFSYYLLSGLVLNDLPVVDHEEMQFILNRNLIRFPFDITKATAMVLAGENQADRLLLGEIVYSGKGSSQIAVKVFLIDVKARTQKHLPMLRGNSKNIYQIQEELLKEVIKVIAPEKTGILFPGVNMSPPDYEKFIKSFLIVDAGKKLDLLLSMNEKNTHSDFLNFELAKIYLARNEFAASESCLNRIAADSLFKDKKDFLLALIHFANGNVDVALNQFIRLQQQNIYAVATNNNLGAIYLLKHDYQTAEKCLRYALYLKKDPEIYSNMILLLKTMGRKDRALEELNRALQMFPDNGKLLKQFSAFLAEHADREWLTQAFRNYLPPLPQSEESLPIEPLLKNPFQSGALPGASIDGNSFYFEARNLFLENDFSGAMQKTEEAMEVNPFLTENHHLLAMLYLQKKNYPQAEMYAKSALFLKESLDNFMLKIKIYQAWKDKEKFRETLELALGKFPQNAELLELKSRGH